jgi:predicted DsbA family dithiol-disulfide isomerase
VRIDVWSDVVCPWCHIGLANLDVALAGFEEADEVDVVLHSFQLDPDAVAEPAGRNAEMLAERYGRSVSEMRAQQARIASLAAERGLDLRLDATQRGNTFDAHRLLHLALERGVQRPLKARLGRLHFTEGGQVGDHAELRQAAVDVGLDGDEVDAVLASDAYADAVRADIETARRLGITGVPFFVAGGRLAVSGAQPPEILGRFLRQAWEAESPAA